jgi:hypothetical protein
MKRTFSLFLLMSIQAWGGAFGVGNTADLAMHLQFAKTSAISFLKAIDAEQLAAATVDADLNGFYQQCREIMFRGALKTEFSIVNEIPDGHNQQAVMKRKGRLIEVNRYLLEKMAGLDLMNASRLTAYLLHEVGHDCLWQGQPVDDSFDPLLDRLANTLVQISGQKAFANFLTLDFIEKIEKNQTVYFSDLAWASRLQLTNAYLDYFGDWSWSRFQQWFSPLRMERPVPASRFNADQSTSIFVGWNQIPVSGSELKMIVRQLLESAFQSQSLTYRFSQKDEALPTQLQCRRQRRHQQSGVACDLDILWPREVKRRLGIESMKINFWTGILGELKIDNIQVL